MKPFGSQKPRNRGDNSQRFRGGTFFAPWTRVSGCRSSRHRSLRLEPGASYRRFVQRFVRQKALIASKLTRSSATSKLIASYGTVPVRQSASRVGGADRARDYGDAHSASEAEPMHDLLATLRGKFFPDSNDGGQFDAEGIAKGGVESGCSCSGARVAICGGHAPDLRRAGLARNGVPPLTGHHSRYRAATDFVDVSHILVPASPVCHRRGSRCSRPGR